MKNQYIIPEIEIAVISRNFADEDEFVYGADISDPQGVVQGKGF